MSAEAKALKIDAGAQRGSPAANGILQRKCACGGSPGISGDCKECQGKRLQRKLTIGASNDPLEQEADRVADQVMAAPAHSEMSSTPLRIQRYSSQATQGADTAPVSVDRVLASSGSPLEPALRQNMEQRFGHDFSRVRVHSGREAGKSARDVDSKAYTVGHNIVFGAGQFTPGTRDGQLLIAHELTHVVQQSPPTLARFSQKRGVANGTMPATGIAAHCGQMLIQRADGSEYRGSGGKSGGGEIGRASCRERVFVGV